MPQPVILQNNRHIERLFGKGSIAIVSGDLPFILSPTQIGAPRVTGLVLKTLDTSNELFETDRESDVVEALERHVDDFRDVLIIDRVSRAHPCHAWEEAAALFERLSYLCENVAARMSLPPLIKPATARCVQGGPLHNFQPRYTTSSVPVVFRNLNLRQTKAVDLARLIEAQTTRVQAYCCDVCTWCGMVVNQQHNVSVAQGPNGEREIEVQVEGNIR